MQKVYFSTLLALGPRFLPLLFCYLYSFLFKISLLSFILKSAQKQVRVTCKSLQNSPLFSQSVLKGAKCRRRLYKINRVFFAPLPSLIRFLASPQTFPLTVRAHRQLPSSEIRQKHAKVTMDKTDRLHFLGDQQFLVHGRCTQRSQNVVATKLNSRIPLLFPYDSLIPTQLKQEIPLPLIIKIPASRSFFQLASRVSPQKTAKSRIPPNLLWTLCARGRPPGKQTPPFSSLISQVGAKTDQNGNLPQQSPLMFNNNKNVQIIASAYWKFIIL